MVVVSQERKLGLEKQIGASRRLSRSGWKCFGGQESVTLQGQRTGGVCIVARNCLDMWCDVGGASIVTRHLSHRYLRAYELGTVSLYSVYMQDSAKLSGPRAAVFHAVRETCAEDRGPIYFPEATGTRSLLRPTRGSTR
eukprot:4264167-Pyramimonas_sp.AAC.1